MWRDSNLRPPIPTGEVAENRPCHVENGSNQVKRMSIKSTLRLSQRIDENKDRWVMVKLGEPQTLSWPSDPNLGRAWQQNTEALKRYQYWGKWWVGDNSVTNSPDTAYTVGTSLNPQYKFWTYSIVSKEFQFVEGMAEGGGGLAFGETEQNYKTTLVLRDAVKTKRGFEPMTGDHGRGYVLVNSQILFFYATVWWEWAPTY
jgi:hypothetical protein